MADCIETPSQSEKTRRDKQMATVRRILLILVRKSRDLLYERIGNSDACMPCCTFYVCGILLVFIMWMHSAQ